MKSMVAGAMLALAVAGLTLAGCGADPGLDGGDVPTIPVKGTVTKAGKALASGIVTLEPLPEGGSTNQAVGTIDPDGTFTVSSGPNSPGAMPGRYRVKVENAEATKTLTRSGKSIEVEVKADQPLEVRIP